MLECELKWAITTNKARGGDRIPVELFQILNNDAVKVLHSICQQIWRTQQWPQDWKRCRGTRDQIANICWIIEKAREFQKNIYFCFIDYAKAFVCVDHNKLWNILKEIGIQNHQTCLLRNLYAGQEATLRTGHGTTDCFQIRKGVCEGCILSPCLFNFYVELS